MGDMADVPLACTLSASAADERMAQWRRFGATYVDTAQPGDTRLRLRLRPGDEALVSAADLAAREQQCCAFFTFAIDIDARERWLRIEVPDDAAAVLATFAEVLAPPAPGRR